jgi:hypothetical protein
MQTNASTRENWMGNRTRVRMAAALAALVATAGFSLVGCGGSSDSPGGVTRTTQSEDQPDPGPQSGTNPAGGEPVPGTSPASG